MSQENNIQNADLSALVQEGQELKGQTTLQPQAPEVGDGIIVDNSKLQPLQAPATPAIKDDDFILMPSIGKDGQEGVIAVPADAITPALQENRPELAKSSVAPGAPGEHLTEYVKDYDAVIKTAGQQAMANGYDPDKAAERRAEQDAKEAALQQQVANKEAPTAEAEEDDRPVEERFNEAMVIIEKSGMGVINFTPEEQEKLERAKKIKLQEVETVDLKMIKSKKPKKNSLKKILERQPSVHEVPIVLPASGYTATIRGCSTYDLMALAQSTNNALLDAQQKWSLAYSKIVSLSIGDREKMSFNEWLKATAATDWSVIVYGLLAATYPENDVIPINCVNPECRKPHEHPYSIKSLLRAEKMSDKLKDAVKKIIDSSFTAEDALATHNNAEVNQVKSIRLPVTGYIAELYVQSAYDLIFTTIKGLNDSNDSTKAQASMLSTTVKKVYIEDEEEEGLYNEFDDAQEITDIIYSLPTKDILVLTNQSENLLLDNSFEFGLMDINCPHCKDHKDSLEFDLEEILFYQYQQDLNTSVE